MKSCTPHTRDKPQALDAAPSLPSAWANDSACAAHHMPLTPPPPPPPPPHPTPLFVYCWPQRKLSSLEAQHEELHATHADKAQALDATLAEAARLDREVNKLTGSLEKLESR